MGLFGPKQQPITADQLSQNQRTQEQIEADRIYRQGIITMRDLIAPPRSRGKT